MSYQYTKQENCTFECDICSEKFEGEDLNILFFLDEDEGIVDGCGICDSCYLSNYGIA